MKPTCKNTQMLILTWIVVLTMVIPTQPAAAQTSPGVDRAGGAKNRIEVVLEASTAPAPGGVATLTLSATPLIAAPDLNIRWAVPAGVELLGRETESLGAVSANQTVQSQRQVRFPSSGIYKIAAEAAFSPGVDIRLGASGVLFFTVRAFTPQVSDRDPQAHSPMHSKMPAQMTLSDIQPNRPSTPTRDPCFTVMGSISRMDKPSTPTGFGPNVTIPLRNAVVEVRESDIFFDDSYGEVVTDASGNFSFPFCDDDGWFDDELEIYVRLWAELRDSGHTAVEVSDIIGIDEVYEFNTDWFISSGGTLSFNIALTEDQSEVFNIADAILDAFQLWNDSGGASTGDRIFSEPADARWDPHEDESISHYDSDWGEITIADDPSDPDMWDDSVIIHEWGHMATDEYSCNESPGGPHSANALIEPRLAWAEGYADYYQSAVRAERGDPFGNLFINLNGMGTMGFSINIETWDVDRPAMVSARNEIAVAATLWDFIDLSNDGQDTISHGHPMIQSVYTSEAFEDNEICTFNTYLKSWVQDGNPADAATAAAVLQNTGFVLSPSGMMTVSLESPAVSSETLVPTTLDDSIWWNRLSFIVDNSASMAGPKLDAAKTALNELVNDLGAEPEGSEFSLSTFNNSSNTNDILFAGQFFPDRINGVINSLAGSGLADPECQVNALDALAQGVAGQSGVDAWLFTDGDTYPYDPSVENIRQMLNDQNVRASIVLLGLCPALTTEAAPSEELTLAREKLAGALRAYLGAAAPEPPGGLVPYLLTAINSGGQFLYVDPSQVADAANILRAQITHSAGAGRWSDYVSDSATYRYDRLATFEYEWMDAENDGGMSWGTPAGEGYVTVNLPFSFDFYDTGGYSTVYVYENGYLTWGSASGGQPNNTPLPNPDAPNEAIYPLWDDLETEQLCRVETPSSPESPECGVTGTIYSKEEGDWFAIEWAKFYPPIGSVDFEVLLNRINGEIRYQYEILPDGAGSATIGLENKEGNSAVQVSYNDADGASEGMGYKFIPAPPKPAQTYSVAVDSLMDGVGFLLTGYSGDFDPLIVRYPNGTLVDCEDTADVLCLDLGLVQYVQVNVNGRVGDWKATVGAGPSGGGTFSFMSMAASALGVDSRGDHSLSSSSGSTILTDLGQAVDDNQLTAWFRRTDGAAVGSIFNLYDDGAHGDGLAGDGIFGSPPYTPSGQGSAYLWVEGQLGGIDFERSDPVPYTFFPLDVDALGDLNEAGVAEAANLGGATQLEFQITNNDAFTHYYFLDVSLPEGWRLEGLPPLGLLSLDPGESHVEAVDVYMGPGSSNDLPSGATGEVHLTVLELEKMEMSDTATARVTRRRSPASIVIHNPTPGIRPNGDQAPLEIFVLDDQQVSVADGTAVALTASIGEISPTIGLTEGGIIRATFTSDASTGEALITADATNLAVATTTIDVNHPSPHRIELAVSDDSLQANGASTANLVATVTDRWGTPMPGQLVRIGVTGDGQLGLIQGGEVVTGTTNTEGQLMVVYTAGTLAGQPQVRAELLTLEGSSYHVGIEASRRLNLLLSLYLPLVQNE